MVVQMVSIGEESGQLDAMLGKVADFFEQEVDDAVAGLSQPMEPLIMVFLGTIIGGLVVAMYLPIFKARRHRLGRLNPCWRAHGTSASPSRSSPAWSGSSSAASSTS